MSQIVCNTGPLIALGILDRLDILKNLFQSVLGPGAVRDEIEQGGKLLPGLLAFRRADWIEIVQAVGKRDELLESLLDAGEASVISLARERNVSLVLIDERKARKVARDIYGLQPIGTARILVEAKRKNILPEITFLFQVLKQEGYWIHETIVATALKEVGEKHP